MAPGQLTFSSMQQLYIVPIQIPLQLISHEQSNPFTRSLALEYMVVVQQKSRQATQTDPQVL